jgi:acyl CoA:acetate/3-ketoacid CoA transferase beta subunit
VVLDVTPEGLKVVEVMEGWTLDQVRESVEARLLS